MKRLALLLMIAAGMCGCDGGIPGTPEQRVNSMTPPVKLIAVSAEGDTIIQDATGSTAVFPAAYYFSKAIREAFKVGDTIKPANHAPVVVTNECKYCAWARQQAGPWPTNHLRTPFTIELEDQTGGTHRITFPTNWFSTPIPVLYGRVYVTNAVEK